MIQCDVITGDASMIAPNLCKLNDLGSQVIVYTGFREVQVFYREMWDTTAEYINFPPHRQVIIYMPVVCISPTLWVIHNMNSSGINQLQEPTEKRQDGEDLGNSVLLETLSMFYWKTNLAALWRITHLTPFTQKHLKKVYASLGLCMLVAATGAHMNVVAHFFQAGFLSTVSSFGLLFWLLITPHRNDTEPKRLLLLAGFAFLIGVGLGPELDSCIAIDSNIVPSSFLGTTMTFSSFTLNSFYGQCISCLYLGGILMSALSLILISYLGNLFFISTWLSQANVYIGLAFLCGLVIFDTQLIIEKAEKKDEDYISHCMDLFLDFVTLFRRFMVIIEMNEKGKLRKK
ncbi:bax inhibitor 1-like [Dromiciops gliroides]|uniref:bax inhibitor 1-like n=1 Tax=Dromiciops gliroides TaxID=33562 RepID=UPI001CC56DF2|nr:bax inhibitor 1-like [Dromiciops gliroides]